MNPTITELFTAVTGLNWSLIVPLYVITNLVVGMGVYLIIRHTEKKKTQKGDQTA